MCATDVDAIGRACKSVSQCDWRLCWSMLEVSMKLWRAEAAERNEIGLCLISISLKVRVNVDKNSSFASFSLCGKTISASGQTKDSIHRQKRSRSGSLVLVTGLEIISGESPDTMTGQIQFSSVTYCFCTFVILFSFIRIILSFVSSFLLFFVFFSHRVQEE